MINLSREIINSVNSENEKDDVDVLIEKIISAKDRQELETATKALDRVLMWGFYVIPHWYLPETRVVFWDKFGYPENTPMHGTSFSYWWAK